MMTIDGVSQTPRQTDLIKKLWGPQVFATTEAVTYLNWKMVPNLNLQPCLMDESTCLFSLLFAMWSQNIASRGLFFLHVWNQDANEKWL